jgi:hypothetical protein
MYQGASNNIFWRWWDWWTKADGWIYAIWLTNIASSASVNTWFRCAK